MSILGYRKKNGLTQESVSKELNVDRSTVSKWETGEFLPSTENLIKLAKLYNCSIDALLEPDSAVKDAIAAAKEQSPA